MDLRALEEIGFTPAEAKVFTSLLAEERCRAGQIVKSTNLHNSAVHAALGSLMSRGFVSYVKDGNLRVYQACSAETLFKELDRRKAGLRSFMHEASQKRKTATRHDAEVFIGMTGFRAAHYKVLESLRRGSEWYFFAFYSKDPEAMEQVHTFYREFERERNDRGIQVKGIAPRAWEHYYRGRAKANILLTDLPLLHNINICADHVILTPWDDGELALCIHSKDVASHFRRYFMTLWKHSAAGSRTQS